MIDLDKKWTIVFLCGMGCCSYSLHNSHLL